MLDIVAELQALIDEFNAEIERLRDFRDDDEDDNEKEYQKGVNMGKRQAIMRIQLLLQRVKSDIARSIR